MNTHCHLLNPRRSADVKNTETGHARNDAYVKQTSTMAEANCKLSDAVAIVGGELQR